MTSDEYLTSKLHSHQIVELRKKKPKKGGLLKSLLNSCCASARAHTRLTGLLSRLSRSLTALLGLGHSSVWGLAGPQSPLDACCHESPSSSLRAIDDSSRQWLAADESVSTVCAHDTYVDTVR